MRARASARARYRTQARVRARLADAACAILGALALSLAVPSMAHAYVDPSVVTYTIQAVAGVAVALGAVLGVALRRTRKLIFRLLKIDENANKAVDLRADAIEGEAERTEANDRARALRQSLDQGRPARPLGWGTRFVRALIGCAFAIATILIFAPLELVAANVDSLLFGFFDVTTLIIVPGVVMALVAALALSLLRGRAFDLALTLVVAIGLGCYVQALFLNVSLPEADGLVLNLMDYKRITTVSTVVWVALFAAMLYLNANRRAVSRAFVLVVSVLLLVVQAISMGSVAAEQSAKTEGQENPVVMTTYGINEVGAEGSVTVFVLDMFDTKVMDDILEQAPQTLDEFTGFTYFRNSVGSLIPTRYGVPFLLTNVMPEHGETFDEFIARRYEDGTLVEDVADAGYEIGVYSNSVSVGALEPYAANIRHLRERTLNDGQLWLSLEKMALFREAPWLLKPLFWFYTNELNANSSDTYYIDDPLYGERLRSEGLEVSENAERTFRFIHLHGSHWPYTMDATGHLVAEADTNRLLQSEGSLGLVAEYIRELKRLGLYDQSTIIVTADHGDWDRRSDPLTEPSTPILLVKPSETATEAEAPLKVSEVPTGHMDVAATIIDAVGGDTSAYGPTVFEVPDAPRDRYYWMTTSHGNIDHSWLEYLIQGHVLDMDDWHLTGEEILIDK